MAVVKEELNSVVFRRNRIFAGILDNLDLGHSHLVTAGDTGRSPIGAHLAGDFQR